MYVQLLGHGNFTALVIATIVALLPLLIFRVFYRLVLHPLSRFPGPKIWACSRLPYLYYLLTGTLIKKTRDLHEQYGEIIRLAPDELSFATEQAWTDIYTYRRGHKRAARDKTWYIAPENEADNIITTSNEKFHARIRAVLSASFTEDALAKQFSIIEKHANTLVAQLRQRSKSDDSTSGISINMTDWLNFFTMDVIGDLAFGEPFNCLSQGFYHDWVRTLFSYLKGMILAAACRFYPITEALMTSLIPQSVLDGQRKHAQYANDRINHRLDSNSTRFERGNPFNFVIVGGSETTATVLTGIFNHVVRPCNQGPYERLKSEIRSQFQKEEDITHASINGTMPYLEATIQEGLRMCNPIPGGLFRSVPPGGDVYCGEYVPEGTHISVRTFSILRSKKCFHNPDKFIPDRWLQLNERPKEYANDHLEASKPFSVGFHSCLGWRLAMTELRLILTKLIWNFEIEQDPSKVVDFDQFKVMVIIQKEDMFLRVRERVFESSL